MQDCVNRNKYNCKSLKKTVKSLPLEFTVNKEREEGTKEGREGMERGRKGRKGREGGRRQERKEKNDRKRRMN